MLSSGAGLAARSGRTPSRAALYFRSTCSPRGKAAMRGDHDGYGKAVLRDVAGTAFDEFGSARRFTFGNCRGWGDIDGVVADDIAVEIESRNSKQVRGAVLDLMWHRSE